MRRTMILLSLGAALLVAIACSKKKAPPTAPPDSPSSCSVGVTSLDFGSVTVGSSVDCQRRV